MESTDNQYVTTPPQMVPVNRNEFRVELSDDPVVQGFADLILLGKLPSTTAAGLSQRGRITMQALHAIATGGSGEFAVAFQEISRRQITDDADWLYDDYLLFALIVGKRRFGADGQFLSKVLDQRRKVQGSHGRELLDDFEKLMSQDTAAHSPVLLVGTFLSGQLGHRSDGLIAAYRLATSALFDPRASEFLRILAMRTVDLVVECSPMSDAIPAVFWRTFQCRATRIAQFTHFLLCVLVAFIWCYLGAYFLFGSGAIATWAEKLFGMSLVIAPSGVLLARRKVVCTLKFWIIRFWGGSELASKLAKESHPE